MRFLCVAFLALGCVSTSPVGPRGSESQVDSVELFRRARFEELASVPGNVGVRLAERLRPEHVDFGEDLADSSARIAYRRGDARTARRALNGLPEGHRTRRLLEALLAHADAEEPLRTRRVGGAVELPLDRAALALGVPVVELRVDGRTLRMVWDTGATENVLSPEVATELYLPRTEVQFPVLRDDEGFVVRFAATATQEIQLGHLVVSNVPWLVSDVGPLAQALGRRVDGFLSPQLLIPGGCFEVDREQARLELRFGAPACREMLARCRRAPVFSWDGEVFASARIADSPPLAVQMETGSPVSFLRADASRWVPKDTLDRPRAEEEIARELPRAVSFEVAGQRAPLSAIDLAASRTGRGYDDIATLGTDVLLAHPAFVVSFATMELGIEVPDAVASR